MYWGMQATENLFGFESSQPKEDVMDVFMFDPMQFVYNLRYMGIGMLTIFAVIGVIIAITALLNKVLSRKK